MALTYGTNIARREEVSIRVTSDEPCDDTYGEPLDYTAVRDIGGRYVVFRGEEDGGMEWIGDAVCDGDLAEFQRFAEAWIRDFHERVRWADFDTSTYEEA